MIVSILAAMASNRVIGIENRLPWKLAEDLQHFRKLTMGHHILMGRKTFESIGKPLPGRVSVVISRNPELAFPGVKMAGSIEEALALCDGDEEVFVVGGGEIYRQAMDVADRIHLTEILQDFAGDAHFPRIDSSIWREVSRDVRRGEFEYHFVIYERITPRTRPEAESR
ncbi:MAG: dihydrofolate reductase [Burkholderiales bacterium]|nr:dihydrofolate reductase [Burkholderiales bacterium]